MHPLGHLIAAGSGVATLGEDEVAKSELGEGVDGGCAVDLGVDGPLETPSRLDSYSPS